MTCGSLKPAHCFCFVRSNREFAVKHLAKYGVTATRAEVDAVLDPKQVRRSLVSADSSAYAVWCRAVALLRTASVAASVCVPRLPSCAAA